MAEAVRGGHGSADGPFTERAARVLREELGAAEVLLTTSCTAALELSALLLGIGPGSTVIVPSFTFVSTALAFSRLGARLLFADIDETTLGLDPDHVASLLDDSVRAVVAVHYAGVACDLTGLGEVLAASPEVDLVEDNAHGIFGRYRDRPLGSFGRTSTLSFHATKTFTCGEGGALVLNRADDIERARTMREKGTNRQAFKEGRVDAYTWVDTGSSYGLSDTLAAQLLAQLEARERILDRRERLWRRYAEALAPHADRLAFRLPTVPPDRDPAHAQFHLLLPEPTDREQVVHALAADGIHTAFHYVPLHSSPMGASLAAAESSCPVTDDVSRRLLRLPFSTDQPLDDVDRVVDRLVATLERVSG